MEIGEGEALLYFFLPCLIVQQCIDATGWEEMLIPRPSFMRSKSLRTESKLIKRAPFNAPFSSWPHAGDLGATRVSSSKGKFGRLMKSRVDRQVRIVYELASYSLNRAPMLRVLYYILKRYIRTIEKYYSEF